MQQTESATVEVTMYCTDWCPYCVRAEKLLASKGTTINKINLDDQPDRRAEMVERTGRRTVPQIYIGDRYVGGHDDVVSLLKKGDLEALLRDGFSSTVDKTNLKNHE